MTYAILGTGAIGGYYGARLAQSGQDVHFLFHSDYEEARAHGLTIDSCNGDFCLNPVNAYHDVANMPMTDVVIVSLKTIHNHQLLPQLLSHFMPNHPLVLLIQNGIGVEKDVQTLFPQAELIAGLAFICSAKIAPAHVNHQFYGSINFGNYSVRDTVRLETLLADFRQASIKTNLVDYQEARWRKAVWNMPFNGMTVALRTQTDQLLKHPATRELIRQQMLEVIGAAQELGVKGLDTSFADEMIESTLQMPPYSPSMRLDYDFNRPMEIEYLYTRPLIEAESVGFSMPYLRMLETQLRFIEESSLRGV